MIFFRNFVQLGMLLAMAMNSCTMERVLEIELARQLEADYSIIYQDAKRVPIIDSKGIDIWTRQTGDAWSDCDAEGDRIVCYMEDMDERNNSFHVIASNNTELKADVYWYNQGYDTLKNKAYAITKDDIGLSIKANSSFRLDIADDRAQSIPSYMYVQSRARSHLHQNSSTYPISQHAVSNANHTRSETYHSWQLSGEKQKLIDERNRLQNKNKNKFKNQINTLNKIIQDQLTDILYTIKTADFDTALKTFEDYKAQLTKPYPITEIATEVKESQMIMYWQEDLSSHAGFQAAEKLLQVRSDYKIEIIKKNIAKKAVEFRQTQQEKFNEKCRQAIAQDKAAAELTACIDTWSNQLSGEHAAVYKNRIDAAQEVIKQDVSSVQKYKLSHKASSMLADFGIDVADFATLQGNTLQQVLHNEFVSTLNKLAPIHEKYQHIDSIHRLNKITVESLDIGRQYNQLNNVAMASQLADFSRHVALVQDVMIGMLEGVGQGAVNVAHMAMHPIETVQHMAQGAATALKGLFYAVLEQQEIEFALESGQLDVADARIHAVQEKFNRVQTVIKDKLSQMSARDISREVTSLGTEFYLQGKLLGAIGEFFTYAQEQLPKIAESAATLLQDERALLSTVEGIPVHIADEALNAMKTEHMQLQGIDKVVGGAQKVLSVERSLLETFTKDLLGKLEKEIEHLRNIFDLQRKGFGKSVNKFLKFDYQHILGFDLHFPKKGGLRLGGLHHDFMNIIENSSSFKFMNKVMHESGFYKADIWVNGRLFKDKTFFPAHWSREKVIGSICEAYDNFKNSTALFELRPDGKCLVRGITKEGIKIEMYVTQNGLITSAYPILT